MKTYVFLAVLLIYFVPHVLLQQHHPQPPKQSSSESQLDFSPIREQLNLDNKSKVASSSTNSSRPDHSLTVDGSETSNYELICFMAEILEERSNLLFSMENSDEMDLLTNLLTGDRSRTGHKLGKFFIPRVG